MTTLVLTDRARTELADGANRGVRAVTLTRLALGEGTAPAGTDDTGRTTLRNQRDAVAVTGDTAVAGRIAYRADFSPTSTYAATELGLFARTGAGAEWLLGYWAGAAAADAIARTHPGTPLVVAGIIEVAASAAAILAPPSPTIQVFSPPQATTSVQGIVEMATVDEALAGRPNRRAIAPPHLRALIPAGVILDYGGSVAPDGWLLCDGAVYSETEHPALYAAIGRTFGGVQVDRTFAVPDLRRRATVGAGGVGTADLGNTVGSRGGVEEVTLRASQMPSHSHGDGTLATDAEAAHSHGDGTLRTDNEAAHSHGDGSLTAARAGDHRHVLPTEAGAEQDGSTLALLETDRARTRNDNPSMSSAGAHTHDVTGATAPSGSHSHDVTGATAASGSHSHDVTGTTGATGGGGAHLNLPPSLVLTKIIRT